MQPVLEANYDSETQCCVDTQHGTASIQMEPPRQEATFADHYVTKRKKKLRKKGTANNTTTDDSTDTLRHLKIPVPKRPPLNVTTQPPPGRGGGGGGGGGTLLSVHTSIYDSNAVPHGALSSTAVRRLATGAAPPGFRPQRQGAVGEGAEGREKGEGEEGNTEEAPPSYEGAMRGR